MTTVHQAVASFVPRDAVSEAARAFRALLEKLSAGGPGSSTGRIRPGAILAEGIHRSLAREAVHFRDFGEGNSEDIIVYHVSTDSLVPDWLLGRPERVVVYYHNITPAFFFDRYDPETARRLTRARQQMLRLAPRAAAAAAPSQFSVRELEDAGYRNVNKVPYPLGYLPAESTIAPTLRELSEPEVSRRRRLLKSRSPDGQALPRRSRRGRRPIDVLFVGRITPNKAQHQVLRLGHLMARSLGADVSVSLVGATHVPLYRRYLAELSSRLGFGDRPFLGSLDVRGLADRYRLASYFVSFSRHEGFFVPPVEAMAAGLPVIALDRAAVGETVGYGGVVVPEDDLAVFAALVAEIEDSPDLRRSLASAGRERAAELSARRPVQEAFLELLEQAKSTDS
jgi:glycosyltransferase involved in cell wall biosynthesis